MKQYFYIILLVLSMISNSLHAINHNNFAENPRIIFFDVEGTLIELQGYKSALEFFSLTNSLTALFMGNTKEFYTDKLSQIPSPCPEPNYNAIGMNGKNMPAIQRDYLLGKLDSPKCFSIINNWLETNKSQFKSNFHAKLFKKMVDFYFEPKTFLKHHKYTNYLNLLKKLHGVRLKNNKRGNILVILSNQSKEHVEVLKVLFPEIFQYSDIQIFSAYEGQLKPNAVMFEKCFSQCPKKSLNYSILVDNSFYQTDNIKVGNHNIDIVKPKEAERRLKSEGFLPS